MRSATASVTPRGPSPSGTWLPRARDRAEQRMSGPRCEVDHDRTSIDLRPDTIREAQGWRMESARSIRQGSHGDA